jgi:hypothetical protein
MLSGHAFPSHHQATTRPFCVEAAHHYLASFVTVTLRT